MYPLPNDIPECPKTSIDSAAILRTLKTTYADWCDDHENAEVCGGIDLLKSALDGAKERFESFTPAQDYDRDLFAAKHDVLRGTWWRGKDCSDLDSDVYPGRTPVNNDIYFDSDCNNLKGVSDSGDPIEEIY